MAPLKFGAYLILLCVLVANTEEQRPPSDDYFSVTTELWGDCRRINGSTSCYRTRDAFCVRNTDDAIAPWYYCEQNGLQRVPEVELCAPESCVQDCVVSVWSEWSECNCSASNYRSRCRDIVVPPRNGGAECPQLLQNDTCSCRDTIDYLPRNYTWKLGKWGECESAMSTNSRQPYQCYGLRTRSVQCVDLGEVVVDDSYCLLEDAYSHVLPPVMSEFCEIPCLCVLGDWSDWGECTPVCDTPTPYAEERRERAVLQLPTAAGACEDTVETRRCEFNAAACPQYTWNTSDWSGCSFDDGRVCGIGLSQRYVYCLKTLDGNTRSVSLEECDERLSDPRPSNLDLCETPCPQDCFVGRWSAWSSCPASCNVTYSNRTRNVLIELQGDGADCPHLIEYLQCPVLPCVQWMTGDFSSCFPTSGTCGNGTKTRNVYCADPSGMGIAYDKCTHLPQPGRSDFCYKPCANDCVISEWTTWSQCIQDCGSGNGIQTRTRRLLAHGTGPCPFETANLTETQSCVSNTPCSEAVYHVQLGEWSDCAVIPLDASGDAPPTLLTQESSTCGVGMQTRTAVCFKNDQVIAEDECPFAFQSHFTRRCNVSCSRGCVVSEWEDFSTCSVTCGDGYRLRSRRLLQFSNPPDASCPADLNSRGIETETISCHMPACPAENTWLIHPWSECFTHPTVLSRLPPESVALRRLGTQNQRCGLGFQNRSIFCVDERRGDVLPDGFCSHLLDEKPATLRSCVVQCANKCIVSPWSEFGLCADGELSRSREIIPFEDSSDWMHDCPELVDVPTEDAVPCSGDDTQYSWTVTSVWGNCVIDAPDAMCGSGYEYRSIACVDRSLNDPKHPVSEELCLQQVGPMPASKRPCTVLCERDCILSDWSEFSECNVTSGYGYKSRTREVTQPPQEGGRECGPLVEHSICYVPPNEISHRYVVTTYGCRPENTSAVCGEGQQLRELVCLVNGVEQLDTSDCSHNPPFRNHSCTLPCPGECVVSDWGPYDDCPDVCPVGQICHQTRFRVVVREGSGCPNLVQRRRCSQIADPYMWRVQLWQGCKVNTASSVSYCGNGVQERIVECVNILTNETAYEEQCGDSERPTEIRACDIACPVDCQVSPFSAWSECPSDCVFTPEQTRERSVVIHPRNGGRECPSLSQQRSCVLRNCDVYIFQGYESRCSPAYTVSSTCGSVPAVAPASCLKNNRFVDIRECVDAVVNVTRINVQSHSEGYCDLECPLEPECAWSEWSECQTLCLQPGDEELSFRARKLLKAHERHRERCLGLQHEPCFLEPAVDAENETSAATTVPPTCIEFIWQTSVWNPDGTRTVRCQSSTGIEVANGCVESLRPVEGNGTCRSTCDDDFFYCNVSSGNCECSPPLYELVSDLCLPVSGCSLNSHCLYPDMVCHAQTRTCTCRAGTRLDSGVCVAIPTTEPTTPPTDPTTVTTTTTTTTATNSTPSAIPPTSDVTTTPTVTDPTDQEPTTELETTEPDTEATTEPSASAGLGILTITLISVVPLIVIIVIVLMLIAIMYRCRKQLEEKQRRDKRERKNRITISEPMPLTRLNNESADEDRAGTLRRGADSASSGFVDDIEHDTYKYGMAGRTFNEPAARTMQPLDIDEAAIRHNAQQYLPQHAQQFMPDGTQPFIPEQQYLSDRNQHYDHIPYEYGAPSSTRSHTPSPLPMSELQQYHHRGNMQVDGHAGRGGGLERQVMGGMISGSEESRISHSSSSHFGRSGEFAYRGVDNYDYLPPAHHMPHHHPANLHSVYRDDRIATGLDGPMVRAIEQLTGPGGAGDGSRSPSISSRSSGRASGRGSRRRRYPRDRGPGVRIQHPTYPGPYPNSPPIASPITPLSPGGPGSSPQITPSPYSPRTFIYPSGSSPYHSTTAQIHSSGSSPYHSTTAQIHPSSSSPYHSTTAQIHPSSPSPYHSTAAPVHPQSPQLSARHVHRTPQNIYISNPLAGTTSPVHPPSPSVTAQHSLRNPHTVTPPTPPPPPPVRNESLSTGTAQSPSHHLIPPPLAASSVLSHSPQAPRQPSPLVNVRHAFRDSADGSELELPQTFTVTPPSSAKTVTSRGVHNPMWNQQHNQA